MILRAALCMKLSSARSICGISTHVSNLNSRTCWTTALKNFPDTLLSATSLLKIFVSRPQIFRSLTRFHATAGQSSSPAIINRPRFLNCLTVSIGFP